MFQTMSSRLALLLLLISALLPLASSASPLIHHQQQVVVETFGVLSSRVSSSKQRHQERIDEAYRKISDKVARKTRQETDYTTTTSASHDDEDDMDDTRFDRFEPTIKSLSRNKQYSSSSCHRQVEHTPDQHPFLQIPCRLAIVKVSHDTDDDEAHDETTHRDEATTVNIASIARRTSSSSSSSLSYTTSGASPSSTTTCCCIDTGAQRTVMSLECVKANGLMRHVDRRYAGQAIGVGGSVQVLGRIPAGVVELQFGSHNEDNMSAMAPSITVIERVGPKTGDSQSIDLLLGLDFLRDHRAVLDLERDDVQLQVHGQGVRVPFMKTSTAGYNNRARRSIPSSYAPPIARSANKDDYADFSDDEDFDGDLDGVDLTGY